MRAFLFITAVLSTLCFQCKKEPQPEPPSPVNPVDTTVVTPVHIIELGKVSMLKNGLAWNSNFEMGIEGAVQSFYFTGSKTFSNGFRESFRIKDIPKQAGKFSYEFYPTETSVFPNEIPNSAFIIMYDGDQPAGDFLLDTLRNDHFIEVLRYDTVQQIAEGRFQVFLRRHDWGGQGPLFPGIPDTISITGGKFHLQVK